MNAFRTAECGEKIGAKLVPPAKDNVDLYGHTRAGTQACGCNDCAEILHGLNNVLASMLLNAQVLEWKLPSYSRSKRYLHEIERNAQRGGELVKQLLVRLEAQCQTGLIDYRTCGEALKLAGDSLVGAADQRVAEVQAEPSPEPAPHSGPVFLAPRKKVPHTTV